MLSIQRVKELLKEENISDISDEETKEIRDSCRLLAEIIYAKWKKEREGLNKTEKISYDENNNDKL